jgi:Rieske Fe-S protein
VSMPISRRKALTGVAVIGAAGPLLAACGSSGTTASDTPTTPTAGGSTSSGSGSTGSGSSSTGVVAVSDVPVGGGVILSSAGCVVTQPTKGDVHVFSNICTHMGCPVSQVQDGTIDCNCHGSEYSIKDGSVVAGPAPSPLPTIKFSVTKGEVVLDS